MIYAQDWLQNFPREPTIASFAILASQQRDPSGLVLNVTLSCTCLVLKNGQIQVWPRLKNKIQGKKIHLFEIKRVLGDVLVVNWLESKFLDNIYVGMVK